MAFFPGVFCELKGAINCCFPQWLAGAISKISEPTAKTILDEVPKYPSSLFDSQSRSVEILHPTLILHCQSSMGCNSVEVQPLWSERSCYKHEGVHNSFMNMIQGGSYPFRNAFQRPLCQISGIQIWKSSIVMDLGLNSYSLTIPNSQVRVQLSSGSAEFDSMLWAAMGSFDKPDNSEQIWWFWWIWRLWQTWKPWKFENCYCYW